MTSVGEYAFRGCSGLATLTLPASVSAIGDASFEGCSDALTLRFPMSYALLGYVHEHHMRYEVLAGNMAMGQGILDASGSSYSCEGADEEGHLRLRLRYEVAQGEGDGLSEMALRLRVPDQAQVLRGSVLLDGEAPEGLAERRGMLTIPVRRASGCVELSVRAAQHGRLQSYASLNYTKGGERHDDLIGYVDEELPKTTMELPALVGAGCLVGGVAAPGSTVTILADGEPAGSGEADAKGRYSIPVSVAGGEGRAYSFQALAAGAASAARDAEYDPAFPEVKSVTLEYRSRGREGRLELMDPSAADQHVHRDISSPPTYRVAFTDPDSVAEVSLTGRGRGKERTIKATRQADGTWATSGFFDESDKGFNPQSVTVHHRARVSAASADEEMQRVNDRLFERFDTKRQEFSWDYDLRAKVEEDYNNELMKYSDPQRRKALRDTAIKLRDETLREFGLDALGSVIPSIGVLHDAVDALDDMSTIAEEGRLIVDLIHKSNSGAGLDDKEKAVLVMHMLRVMECIGTYLVIDELAPTYKLLLRGFVEAQLFSLATLMRVNSAFADDFEGIRSDLKQMGPGNYGNFAAVAERFEGFFGRFCVDAKENAKKWEEGQGGDQGQGQGGDQGQGQGGDQGQGQGGGQGQGQGGGQGQGQGGDQGQGQGGGGGKGKDTDPSNAASSSDPSGYVYEAVPGNRLEGAEVSLYCEDDISQAPLLWDAVAYGQEARQVTGADGSFGWDVPDGRWQVRCAMAGYEPYVGEWLEVPPEHTDVGVAMVCREAPRVAVARVRDGEVLLSFSRYMVPESVGGVRLLDAEGAEVPFELVYEGERGEGGTVYAREDVLRLRGEAQAGPYTLRASGRETSYAGVHMEAGDTAVS